MLRMVLLLALVVGLAGESRAQDLALSQRGPRFLLASTGRETTTVEIDPARAPIFQRRVTLALEHATVGEALRAVSRQAGIRLVYSRDVLDPKAPTRIKAEGITVAGALTEILLGAGVDVVLSTGDRVTLAPREIPPAPGSIVGRVIDKATGGPIAGALVVVQGTSKHATVTSDGSYRIADVPEGTHTVRARYIGYSPASSTVAVVGGEEVTADFALEKSIQRLDEVVTTGTLVETERKALPSPITVITADEIREKNIQRVDQLFRGDVAGAFSFDTGSDDDISRIFVRGGSSLAGRGEVKTYIDGVQVASASILSTIDPGMIERVELIRGPQASTIYGSQALNGVLQIFTKKGVRTPRPSVDGRFAAGAIQTKWADQSAAPTYRGNLAVSGGGQNFSYSVGGTRLYKGEWVTNFRDTEHNLFGGFRAEQDWLTAEFSGRIHTQNRKNAHSPFFRPFADILAIPEEQDINYQTTGVGLTVRARTTAFWEQAVTVGAERLLQEFVVVEPANPGDSLQTFSAEILHSTITFTSSLRGTLTRSLAGSVIAGVDLTSEKSTASGGQGRYNTGDFPKNPFASRLVSKSRGYFAQGQLGVSDQFFFTAGIRAEDDPFFGEGHGLAWAPRAGVAYVRDLGGVTIKPRFSYGKSIRPPFSTARLGSTESNQITLPNPDIGPETQQGFDLGIEVYAGERLSLQATYYDQNVTDLIDQVIQTLGPPEIRIFQNIGKIKNRGVELEAAVGLVRGLTLSGTYSIAESEVRQLSPSYGGDLQVGDQLLGVPKYTGGAGLRYAGYGWTANLGMRVSSSWNHYNFTAYYNCVFAGTGCRNTTGSLADYRVQYPGFTKLRMGISRQLTDRLTARLDVENLANDYSTEERDTNTPIGRTTTVGLDFQL